MMMENGCPRCAAVLTDGYCEYCGWNRPKSAPSKTLTLAGVLCGLVVTKDTCTFSPKVGSTAVIANNEISQISLLQAPMAGTGEFCLSTTTGLSQKITFLHTQNQNIGEIASYLSIVAPQAQFTNTASAPPELAGVVCPKCKSNNTKATGKSRKLSVWKIICGALLVVSGLNSITQQFVFALLLILGGLALGAAGLRLIGKMKTDCLCMNCRKTFRV